MKKWTQVEINIIKTMYLTHRTTNIAKILNRTEYAIERKCRRCNFKRPFAFNSLLLSNKILNSKIKKYNINNNFGWFTSGFVAGEGYFGHCISNKNIKLSLFISIR